jgi:hypothetical protein
MMGAGGSGTAIMTKCNKDGSSCGVSEQCPMKQTLSGERSSSGRELEESAQLEGILARCYCLARERARRLREVGTGSC